MSAYDVAAGLCVAAGLLCLGGLAGLWLAWTQEARIDRWAGRVVRKADAVQRRINAAADQALEVLDECTREVLDTRRGRR